MMNKGEDGEKDKKEEKEEKSKKIMGMEDIMDEEKKGILSKTETAKAIIQKLGEAAVRKIKNGKEDVIVRLTFPKGQFERLKQSYEGMPRDELEETVKNTPLTRDLSEGMMERLVENLMSASKSKLAIVALSIGSVQFQGVSMDIYEELEEGEGK